MPLLLNDMPLERINRIFFHPMHQDGVGAVVQLITELRQCRSSENYFQFQQVLLVKVLAVQEHRRGVGGSQSYFSRVRGCRPTRPS